MKTNKITNDGPCKQALEHVLQAVHVERQAYHVKSFIGNHVQKMLKVLKGLNFIEISNSASNILTLFL